MKCWPLFFFLTFLPLLYEEEREITTPYGHARRWRTQSPPSLRGDQVNPFLSSYQRDEKKRSMPLFFFGRRLFPPSSRVEERRMDLLPASDHVRAIG